MKAEDIVRALRYHGHNEAADLVETINQRPVVKPGQVWMVNNNPRSVFFVGDYVPETGTYITSGNGRGKATAKNFELTHLLWPRLEDYAVSQGIEAEPGELWWVDDTDGIIQARLSPTYPKDDDGDFMMVETARFINQKHLIMRIT